MGPALPTTNLLRMVLPRVRIGLLALDGICGLGFWGAVGHQAMKMRFFLILVPGEAKPLGVPREQKTCCSEHLLWPPHPQPSDLKAEPAT